MITLQWLLLCCGGALCALLALALAGKFLSLWPLGILAEGLHGICLGLAIALLLGWALGAPAPALWCFALALALGSSWAGVDLAREPVGAVVSAPVAARVSARFANTQGQGLHWDWDAQVMMFAEERKPLSPPPSHRLVAGGKGHEESLIYAPAEWALLESGALPGALTGWPQGVYARVRAPSGPVWLICVHADSPISRDRQRNRDAYFRELPLFLERIPAGEPALLMGDFNAGPHGKAWPELARALRERGFLAQSSLGSPTWPDPLASRGIGFRIDHAFAKGSLMRASRALGGRGSDHRAIEGSWELPMEPPNLGPGVR